MTLLEMRSVLEEERKRLSKIAVEIAQAEELMHELDYPPCDYEDAEYCRKDLYYAVQELDMALTELTNAIEDLKNVRV